MGGLVVARRPGYNPLTPTGRSSTAPGLNWFFPDILTADTAEHARPYNLAQTLSTDDDADPHGPRSRVRLPVRPVQHRRPGSVPRRPDRRELGRRLFAGHGAVPARPPRDRARRRSPARVWAGIAGFLKATVGAHEVISTIMLNWIAIYVGAYALRPRRAAAERRQPSAPDLERRSRRARKLPVFWGDPTLQGAALRLLHRHRARSSSSGLVLNRTTLGYEVRAVGFNPDAAAYGGISVRKNSSARWRSRARSPASAARSTCSAAVPSALGTIHVRLVDRLPRNRRRAARPQHRARRRHCGVPLRRPALRNDPRSQHERDSSPSSPAT